MSASEPVFETTVSPDWVDYNGHMRDAYYGLIFSYAIDRLMLDLGMDEAYRRDVRGTLYVIEMHQHFLKEAHEGAPVAVRARLLDADAKRLHVYFEMVHAGTSDLLAVQESLQLHVIQDGAPKSGAFTSDVQAKVEAMVRAGAQQPEPGYRSGRIEIRRKS